MVTPHVPRRYRIVWPAPSDGRGAASAESDPDGARAGDHEGDLPDDRRLLALEPADGSDPAARDRLARELLRLAQPDHPDLVRMPELEAAVPGLAAGALLFAAEGIDGRAVARIAAALAASGAAARASLLSPVPGEQQTAAVLRRLLVIGRGLHAERRLEPLLERVLDAMVELTSAERAFVFLRPSDRGEVGLAASRHVDPAAPADQLGPVRAAAARAATTGRVQVDVLDPAPHAILAAPLLVDGRAIGALAAEHRFRRGAFDDDAALDRAGELAALAAVAIEGARRSSDQQGASHALGEESRRLSAALAARDAELTALRDRLPADEARPGPRLVGRSAAMVDLLRTIDRLADAGMPVVLVGERGTGKELLARALHLRSARRDASFAVLRGGDLPPALVEAELYGHARGAHPGADRDRRGLLDIADGGTLFIDELGDLPRAAQAGLARLLRDGDPRGDARRLDVRLVVASTRGLDDLVADGRLGEDLRRELGGLCLRVPALRERAADIPELVDHVLGRLAAGEPRRRISRAALARLCAHSWPGNVRELEGELARAAAMAEGTIEVGDLSPALAAAIPPRPPRGRELVLRPHVEALERSLIEEALRRTGGNQTAAARLLGVSRFGLQKKLRRHGLAPAAE